MNLLMPALVFVMSTAAVLAQQTPGPIEALDGVDVVVLLKQGKEVFGKQAFRSERGRFAYLFSSAETKAEFDKAPDKYAIQLGGVCARMGGTVRGNASDYAVHEGKIYIFGSDACHKAFVTAPEKYIPKPAAAMPADPSAAKRGMALLDKAAASAGAKLDSVTSYVETITEVQTRSTGEKREIVVRNLWQFPSAARTERTVPTQNGEKISFGTLLTAEGAWGFGGQDMARVIPEALPSVQLDLGRHLVALLRSRRAAGTKVAALGTATIDGKTVERVRVKRGGLDVTLNVDPATGRPHSTTFINRNRDGQFGEYTLVYGDFRTVDGVTVPFEEKALFNGTADASSSRKLQSVSVNPALDAALFKGANR
jgi:YHS domain-containing protein